MNSADRILAALRGQPVDRLPWSPLLAYWWEDQPKDYRDRGQLAALLEMGADPLWRGVACPVRWETPGVDWSQHQECGRTVTVLKTPVGSLRLAYAFSSQGGTSFLVEHPLKTREDFRIQLWIEQHTRLIPDPEPVRAHFAGDGRVGYSFGMLTPRMKTAFQSLVEHQVGTEELAYALADFPHEVEELLAAMVANDLASAEMAATSPYGHFLTWEDSSTQNYSPVQYRRYIQPEITSYCRILAAHGKGYVQHACGHVRDLLAPMRDGGVCAVESLSPSPTGNVTLAEARAKLGAGCGIVGGIEPTMFLRLSDAEFPGYVEQVIADGAGGPFVLANSDSCPPGVKLERFRLVGEMVRRRSAAA